MGQIERTNTNISPLLREPVIERDYTQGFKPPAETTQNQQSANIIQEPEKEQGGSQTNTMGTERPNFDKPPETDNTRPFTFDEEIDNESDLKDGEQGPAMQMPTGSAKTFANFVGNAIQMYLPKATYGYSKIDIEDVMMNVEKGNLTTNWIDIFEKINKNTEEALAIPDESIKMWKSAFKDYLEYKNMSFANPETAFYAATVLLLADQGVRAYQIRKHNEKYMKEAIEASNPGLFAKESVKEKEENINTKDTKDESIAA